MFPVFMAKTRGSYSSSGDNCALIRVRPDKSIWQFGPYEASRISYAVQPDLYMAFLDGALAHLAVVDLPQLRPYNPVRGIRTGDRVPRSRLRVVLHVADDRNGYLRRTTSCITCSTVRSTDPSAPRLACRWACSSRYSSSPVPRTSLPTFHVSLEEVLIAMRVLVVITPLISYPVTYKICKELQAAKGGKRKVANTVTRSEEGEYVATPGRSTLTTCTATSPPCKCRASLRRRPTRSKRAWHPSRGALDGLTRARQIISRTI